MNKEIVTDREALSKRTKEIAVDPNQDIVMQIVTDLQDTILANDLVCLTANQIGYDKRIFCLRFDTDIRTFINPMITDNYDVFFSREHTSSIPGKEFIVPRNKTVVAIYQTPVGQSESNKFLEPAAQLFSQCQQLLDGILLSDIGLEVTPEFDSASDAEREEVLEWYVRMLGETQARLEGEIEGDELLKKTRDAIDFMESVAAGKTTVEQRVPILNRKMRRLIVKNVKNKKSH